MIKHEVLLHEIISWVQKVGAYQKEELAKKNFEVYEKDSKINLVTNVDVESEKRLIQYIKARYPEHTILGEETGSGLGEENTTGDYVWVIDPIDGTTSFIHGFPMYAISVALKYKGITEIGVVYAPLMELKFAAIRGKGAFLNEKKIGVSTTKELIKSLVATGFQYNLKKDNTNLKYFSHLIDQIADIRRTGSAALDLCFVAAGQLDGYWEFDLKEWDIAAGALILKEAGGKIETFNQEGHPLLVCGNPSIQTKLYEKLISVHLG